MASVGKFNQFTKQQIQPYLINYPADYQDFMKAKWQGR